MGSSISVVHEMTPEKQFEVYKQVRKIYDESYIQRMSQLETNDHRTPEENEEFQEWKDKIENILLNFAELSFDTSKYSTMNDSKDSNHNGHVPFHRIPTVYRHRQPSNDCLVNFSPELSSFQVHDIVKVRDNSLIMFEGVIVDMIGSRIAKVDFGDDIGEFPVENLSLVMHGTDYEVGDHVQVRPEGMSLFFTGVVMVLNHDGTLDVKMDGDETDIEYDVSPENCIKLKTGRILVQDRWRNLRTVFHVANTWGRCKTEVKDGMEYDTSLDIRRTETLS